MLALAPFPHSPLPTFESFVGEWRAKSVQSNIQQVEAALEEVSLELQASRLHAKHCYPDDPGKAAQSLYDWACRITTRKLGRELDEKEQAYVWERCQSGD